MVMVMVMVMAMVVVVGNGGRSGGRGSVSASAFSLLTPCMHACPRPTLPRARTTPRHATHAGTVRQFCVRRACWGVRSFMLRALHAGRTLLHLAASASQDTGVPLLAALLRRGLVDITATDNLSATALHYAARENNAKAVRLLLAIAARTPAASSSSSAAAASSSSSSLSLSSSSSSSPSASGPTAVAALLHRSSSSVASALAWATLNGAAAACAALLRHGLPFNVCDDNVSDSGADAATAAADGVGSSASSSSAVAAATAAYTNVVVDASTTNVFLYAVSHESLGCARLLLDHDADVNCRTDHGYTPLLCVRAVVVVVVFPSSSPS